MIEIAKRSRRQVTEDITKGEGEAGGGENEQQKVNIKTTTGDLSQ